MHRCDSLDLISLEKFRSPGRRMHWRSAVLLIVAAAGILIAIAAPKLVVLQSLVMVSSAMLGVVAVVLVRRGARTLPSDPRIARVSQRLRELRRLAAVARQQSLANLDGNPESIAVYPWPEEEDVVRVEDHSVARRLRERLAPPAPETSVDHRPSPPDTCAQPPPDGAHLRALRRPPRPARTAT